jgi:hypothetical protein
MILNMPGAFERLIDSARNRHNAADYWHGRTAWIYLSSIVWNIQKRNIFIAFSRFGYFGYALARSFKFWFSPKFWRGATRSHQPIGWLISD